MLHGREGFGKRIPYSYHSLKRLKGRFAVYLFTQLLNCLYIVVSSGVVMFGSTLSLGPALPPPAFSVTIHHGSFSFRRVILETVAHWDRWQPWCAHRGPWKAKGFDVGDDLFEVRSTAWCFLRLLVVASNCWRRSHFRTVSTVVLNVTTYRSICGERKHVENHQRK